MPTYSWEMDPQGYRAQGVDQATRTTLARQAQAGAPTGTSAQYDPRLANAGVRRQTSGGYRAPVALSTIQDPGSVFEPGAAFGPGGAYGPPPDPLQDPGNNLVNPGLSEQAIQHVQNRLLQDPSEELLRNQFEKTQGPGSGEQFIGQNLGTLSGPGQGDQYWNQVQGEFNAPMAGEQFARDATQQMGAQGQAGAFYNQAQGQYDQFTGYQGPQASSGQYGQTRGELAGGTQGEQGLGQIAGEYGNIGQYGDPNRAAAQYEQTQGAFGDLPIAEFDPFYDRARQLATQDYNRQAAGRGVYGSSEALSGVGNVITDIEAQRANRAFDAEMQRAVEQRNRQALLGEQARMGDLSGLEAFRSNLQGAETFGNLNRDLANTELDRNRLLGDMARDVDTDASRAQELNLRGVETYGNLASEADRAETDRYRARTSAMDAADRTAIDRLQTGANISQGVDTGNREDFRAETNAANQMGQLEQGRTRLGADIANTMSQNDLNRVESFLRGAGDAERARFNRVMETVRQTAGYSSDVGSAVASGLARAAAGEYESFNDFWTAEIADELTDLQMSERDKQALKEEMKFAYEAATKKPPSGGNG